MATIYSYFVSYRGSSGTFTNKLVEGDATIDLTYKVSKGIDFTNIREHLYNNLPQPAKEILSGPDRLIITCLTLLDVTEVQ